MYCQNMYSRNDSKRSQENQIVDANNKTRWISIAYWIVGAITKLIYSTLNSKRVF